jgi:hypothetical protein
MAVGEKNLWFALPASAIATGLRAIQKQRLRIGPDKHPSGKLLSAVGEL